MSRWLLIIVLALLAWGAVAYRLDRTPDIFVDEILYTRAGIRLAAEGAFVWDNGEPIFVHPPLYFMIEGAYLWLTAHPGGAVQAPGDIFAWVYHARYLNALFAGLTALLLYLLGARLRSPGLGVLLAALFILDPFGVRINRRAMLETLAMLWTLMGMALVLTGGERLSLARAVVAGLLLGMGLLTKELTFTAPLAVFLFGLWEYLRSRETGKKEKRRKVEKSSQGKSSSPLCPFLPFPLFNSVIVAGLTYSLFPFWAVTTGQWGQFMAVKLVSVQRVLGLAQLSGWNRPGVSLADFLVRRLADYGSSYLLLALGGLATLWLLLKHRHDWAGRLLGVWGLVLYPFYTFTTLFGAGNDQFFYFLLVPSMIFVGYAGTQGNRYTGKQVHRETGTQGNRSLCTCVPVYLFPCILVYLALVLPYNATRWWITYGTGVDDGYHQLAAYVQAHLPLDQPLNASGDAIKFKYFFPDRTIAEAATPEEAQTRGVHYFVLAPKDVWARYGRITPELAAWIVAGGKQLFTVESHSYGPIGLYQVDYPDARPPTLRQPRLFPPAETGFVTTFLLAFWLWSTTLIGVSLAAWLRSARVSVKLNLKNETYRF